ncbi:hypothetical protein Pmani_003431 [Petrolisthes manimaculis]|uniref:Uncharacterized protein n=1 Tax=Petrolisthes manimaculis TaxID=1843537 RepID=A0AAE1QIJ8_9EUCA|nr:hypothetical protein Pmani_003431 [Petrolisthes manimaculis]
MSTVQPDITHLTSSNPLNCRQDLHDDGRQKNLGIIPLAIQNIFHTIQNTPDREYLVNCWLSWGRERRTATWE